MCKNIDCTCTGFYCFDLTHFCNCGNICIAADITESFYARIKLFILFISGIFCLNLCCLFNLKKYIKHEYRDPFKDAIEEDEASEEDAEPSKSDADESAEKPSDDLISVEEKENIFPKESEISDESDGINSCGEEQTIEQENSGKED